MTGLEPAFCADYANAIADAYIELKEKQSSGSSQNTAVNLSRQADRLMEEIKRTEEKLLTFVRENSVVGIPERGNVAARLLAQLSEQSAKYAHSACCWRLSSPCWRRLPTRWCWLHSNMGFPRCFPSSAAVAAEGELSSEGAESLIEHGLVAPEDWGNLKRERAVLEAR